MVVVLLLMQVPPPAHTRSLSSEMLAVAAPLSITAAATAAVTATPPPLLSTLTPASHGLEVPQGDQPPVPPIKEGPPYRPDHWDKSTQRVLYIKNRPGRYLEMWPNGFTQGVSENNSFCVFVMMSHLVNVVLKGLISDRYLCMNNTTYQLYSRSDLHSDCYMQEAMRNGSGHNVYSFAHCRTPAGKKCYLGLFRNGTMRLGKEARQSQNTAQWLAIPVRREQEEKAREAKEEMEKQGQWRPPARPVVSTPRPVNPREQRRKRVRRWCRNLDIIVKRPHKFKRRCKHDCEILTNMIDNPDRYMRRCLVSHVRRRHRKKGSGPAIDSKKIRDRVQSLWPRRKEIFERLRHLHRCNKRLRRRGDAKRRSCSRSQLRRQQKIRAEKRKRARSAAAAASASASASSSSSSSASARKHSVRSRHRHSGSGRKRIRHQRKRAGEERRRRGKSSAAAAATASPQVQREKRRAGQGALWTALTSR